MASLMRCMSVCDRCLYDGRSGSLQALIKNAVQYAFCSVARCRCQNLGVRKEGCLSKDTWLGARGIAVAWITSMLWSLMEAIHRHL